MDVRDALLGLIAPTALGDLVAGARVVDASTELGLRLTFEDARGREVHVEVDPLVGAARFAARSAHLAFSYRAGDARAPVDPALGLALARRVAELASANEDAFLARARDGSTTPDASGLRVRRVRVTRLLERAGTLGERYYTLSPYVGCLIGCRFCYAPSRLDPLRALSGRPAIPWGSWVDVRENAAEVLAGELRSLPPRPIKLCPIVSDPYHAIERRERVTRACLEALRDAPPRGVMVLTRSTIVLDDAELIGAVPLAHAGVSLPTADDEVRAHFEPRGATVSERLEVLRALRRAGARTFAIVQPILPGSIEALADALASVADSAHVDVLHGTFGASDDFARYPEATDAQWQADRALALTDALAARGVELWRGELPASLVGEATRERA